MLQIQKVELRGTSDLKPPPPESSPAVAVVSLRRLCKRYGSKAAVEDLSLDFYAGEVAGLLGHNGAGKSTTM